MIEQLGRCEICNIYEWCNKFITLAWHHKDGNSKNDSRENVQFLCPNCHSQTENFAGRNLRGKPSPKKGKKYSKI